MVEDSKVLPSNHGYLVDTARGRQATPADIELVAGTNAEGVPTGLARCPACHQWRGEHLWPHEAAYYDERQAAVLHVPAFCGLSHVCPQR